MARALRVLRVMLVIAGVAGGLFGGAAAWADAAKLRPFFGTYEGASLAPSHEVHPRDLKVLIKPAADDGFTVAWQTTLYETEDDGRSKTRSLQFFPRKNNPSVYQAVPTGLTVGMVPTRDPLDGAPFAWARVMGKVLSVYVLTISTDGDYVMQSYDRALTKDGMALGFTRVRNGTVEKRVWGALERVGG